jgi:hypothetical protein
VREAAARAQCQNQLKQIGLALHSHHDVYGYLPAATVSAPALTAEKRLSWLAAILPFVEQEALAKQLKHEQPWDSDANRRPIQTVLSGFLCPGRLGTPKADMPAPTNYVGVAGVDPEGALLEKHHPRAGFFGFERRITFADITDGQSTTAAVIETSVDNGPWAAGGASTLRGLAPAETVYVHENGPFGMKHKTDSFFRTHVVITNTGFADGSVRMVPSDVSPTIFRSLATIAGGEQIRPDF